MSDPGQKPPGVEPEFAFIVAVVACAVIWLGTETIRLWALPGSPFKGAAEATLVYFLPHQFLPHGIGRVAPASAWPATLLILAHFWSVVGMVIGSVVGFAVLWWLLTPGSGVRHQRGRQLQQGAAAATHEARQEGKPNGIFLHPSLQISEFRETRGMAFVGASGAGKTTLIFPIYEQAVARGDKIIVWDDKGDFLQNSERFVLLAPWDARSCRWIPGGDVSTIPQARALAAFLIPAAKGGGNPMWEIGCRQILVAVIATLPQGRWTWAELGSALRVVLVDTDQLKSILSDKMPEARRLAEAGKPTESLLFTLSAWFGMVFDMAEADRALSARPRLILREWVAGKHHPLILRPNPDDALVDEGEHGALGPRFNALVLSLLAGYFLAMPDCKPHERRVWFFLDEVAQIGKMPVITTLLAKGRSKGCRTILGFQEPSQIEELYSHAVLNIWLNNTASKVLGQMLGDNAQEWASKIVGDHEVERFVAQTSAAANWSSNQQASRSTSWQRGEERVLLASEFGQLGPSQNGVAGLLLMGKDAHLLSWPHLQQTPRRPVFEPAAWVLPGWQRAHKATATTPDGGRPVLQLGKRQPRPAPGHEHAASLAPPQPSPDQGADAAPIPTPTQATDEPVADIAADQVQDAALDHVAPGLGYVIEAVGEISEALRPDPTTPSAAQGGLPARRKWRRRTEQDREPD